MWLPAVVVCACKAAQVDQPSLVDRVELSPGAIAVSRNQVADFTAVAFDAADDTASATVSWSATGGVVNAAGKNGGKHLAQFSSSSCGDFQVIVTANPGNKSDSSAATVSCGLPPPPPPPPPGAAVLVGAGDIAGCSSSGDEATAALLDSIPGTVFTAGDNAYDDGTATNFATCYEPSWGRHKARTRPSPGNHDYHTSGASGYYNYYGAAAGDSGVGYYSYDLGDWHIISLNSNVSMSAGSPQEQWLRADLAANTKTCTLAYWHHPRFSSGTHGSSTKSQPVWQALYDYNADLIISGHDHNYQRFAPQTPDGVADPARGIRQFLVGTGGISHYVFSTPIANTEAYNTDTWGVLKLTLYAASYTWEFVPVAGMTYPHSGSGVCH